MPIYEEAREQLRSEIADMINSAGPAGRGRHGGRVPARVCWRHPWAHLDIAGTAWAETKEPYQPKGATGVAVRHAYRAWDDGGPSALVKDGGPSALINDGLTGGIGRHWRGRHLNQRTSTPPTMAPSTRDNSSSAPAMPSDPNDHVADGRFLRRVVDDRDDEGLRRLLHDKTSLLR
jgi:hypothetical protein